MVAEVTQASLGVGYEVGRAVAMNKKILCLYRPQEGKSNYLFNYSTAAQVDKLASSFISVDYGRSLSKLGS